MPNFSLSDNVFLHAASQYPTPFHLYDEKGIRAAVQRLQKAFDWCANFKEYFAIKALPNPSILQILKEEGCGVDCSSQTELMLAETLGFPGKDIMFSANAMPYEELSYARRLNAYINLDDITHIDLLKNHGGIPQTICLRYNPGGNFSIGNKIMGNPGDAKYGFTRKQLSEGLMYLKKLGVKSFGLHAFLSSNTTDQSYYPALAEILFATAVELQIETGLSISFINLSGGIGIPYEPDKPQADLFAIGQGVKTAYEKVFIQAGINDVAIFTELGRYITGPYGWLVTKAIHEKNTYKHYIGVDASACDLIRPAMYGAYHHISVMGKSHLPSDHTYDIIGSLCENNDKFAIDRSLPFIENGDLLVIHDTGAHGHAMGYNYNGRMRCAEVLYTAKNEYAFIRRRETPKDYFSTLDLHPAYSTLAKE
ncbi:MAG: diaminopimelate decarboxylase [Clostridiales bacterium]|nr:diaminopimelate decarboxylase [Clostridiales bacterium]